MFFEIKSGLDVVNRFVMDYNMDKKENIWRNIIQMLSRYIFPILVSIYKTDFKKKEMIKLRVLGLFLIWLLLVVIIIPFNILDFKFKDVYEGNYDFFEWMRWDYGHRSVIFVDSIIVAFFPGIFGLKGISYLITTMLCEAVFIRIYIRIYQWVNKKRDEKKNKEEMGTSNNSQKNFIRWFLVFVSITVMMLYVGYIVGILYLL